MARTVGLVFKNDKKKVSAKTEKEVSREDASLKNAGKDKESKG